MAPVELNIVCFRYRFPTDEMADQLNRQIVIQLQEAGSVAPSATTIGGRLSIRAAMVNHRTSQAEMDTLVAATLAAGRALRGAQQPQWQPWLERDSRIERLDALLNPASDLQPGRCRRAAL